MKRREKVEISLECKLFDTFETAQIFFSEGLKERKRLHETMSQVMNFIRQSKASLEAKMRDANADSKRSLSSGIKSAKAQIEILNSKVKNLKSDSDSSQNEVKKVLSRCESFVEIAVEKRKIEIAFFESYLKQLNSLQEAKFYSCSKCFVTAIQTRNEEAREIALLLESLKQNEANLSTELSPSIDEVLCKAFGVPQGMTFFKMEEEVQKRKEGKLGAENAVKFIEFYSNFLEAVHKQIKKLEESSNLKNTELEVAEQSTQMLGEFIKGLEREWKILESETNVTEKDLTTFAVDQEKFEYEVKNVLDICHQNLNETLRNVNEDIDELNFQLKVLSREFGTSESFKNLKSKSRFQADSSLTDTFEINTINNTMDVSANLLSKGDLFAMEILESALKWRESSVNSLAYELKQLVNSENKSLEIITSCMENHFSLGDRRKKEDDEIQIILNEFSKQECSVLMPKCKECLENLLNFNSDALSSIEAEIDRLTNTIEFMEEEKREILDLCEKDISTFINKMEEEITVMDSDLSYFLLLGSTEDIEIVSSCIDILRNGMEERNQEILFFKNKLGAWSAQLELLTVVNTCEEHLNACFAKKQTELQTVYSLLEVLKEEGEMSNLLYAPALQTLADSNNAVFEWLKVEHYKFFHIGKELQLQAKKILDACQTLYCSLLETFKIEVEGITCDLEFLQGAQNKTTKHKETNVKEVVVNFNDLFMGAFELKRTELEVVSQKGLIQNELSRKKKEVLSSDKQSNTQTSTEENVQEFIDDFQDESIEQNDFQAVEGDYATTMLQYVKYFDTQRENLRTDLKNKALEELQDLEKNLSVQKVDTDVEGPPEDETDETSTDRKENVQNRVYEKKMEQVKNEISVRRTKIQNVITQRKHFMEALIKSKKKNMEESVLSKEREMKQLLNSVQDKNSDVICTLKDIFRDVIELKGREKMYLKDWERLKMYTKYQNEAEAVLVNLTDTFGLVLNFKDKEIEMMKKSKFKEIDKMVISMKNESNSQIVQANQKLEETLKSYWQHEKSRAMENIRQGGSQEYVICDDDIFPDIKSFRDFIANFESPFHVKDSVSTTSEESKIRSKTDVGIASSSVPFIQPHAYALHGLAGHLLKIYEAEMQSISKVLLDLQTENRLAFEHSPIQHSSPSKESAPQDTTRGIDINICSVLNTTKSMLMVGSFLDRQCDIAMNLGQNFGLAYFEKTSNIKKWESPVPGAKEVSVEIELNNSDAKNFLEFIMTTFDWNVTTVPIGSSWFERFVGDSGLVQQMRCALLQLHQQQLLCRKCDMANLAQDTGLGFKNVYDFLCSKTTYDAVSAMYIPKDASSLKDISIIQYLIKMIMKRGALLTAIFLASIMEKLDNDNIKVVADSLFIKHLYDYQSCLKTFVSNLAEGHMIDFVFCNSRSCGVGSALAACVAYHQKSENPESYLWELNACLKEETTLFSTNSFLAVLKSPNLFTEAFKVALRFLRELNFSLPLSVIWAYYFINGYSADAQKLVKEYPVSFKHVNPLICQKICSDENFELAKDYRKFLKTNCDDNCVKLKAFRCIFRILVDGKKYDEAVSLVKDVIHIGIPLDKFHLPSLTKIHSYWVRNTEKHGGVSTFVLPTKEPYSSSSDSDID